MSLIVTSGKQSLHIIDADTGAEQWSLIWGDCSCLSADEKSWLAWYGSGTDEIKPIENNSAFLVTSVCGLLAYVKRETKAVTVIGWAPGAHSIEALPDGFVVAAISHKPALPPGAPDIGGDAFQLYDRKRPRELLWETEAYGAHGVRWDEQRQMLWALEFNALHAFRFNQAEEMLEKIQTWTLPTESGHDLSWYDKEQLLVTTDSGVYLFHLDTNRFADLPPLANCGKVKGISRHPQSGEIVYCYPDPGENVFNSANLHFVNQPEKITVAAHAVYKPRWLVE